MSRPASAAEVLQRVSAIDGQATDESLLVARAYLATPTLIGRQRPLSRARARLKRALTGESSAIAIEGSSGMGRSRMLDACALRATLLGLTVVRVSSDHAPGGDWGVARSIAMELSKAMPDAVMRTARPVLDVLGHALPELAAREPQCVLRAIEPEQLRPRLQQALREWLAALSRVAGLRAVERVAGAHGDARDRSGVWERSRMQAVQ